MKREIQCHLEVKEDEITSVLEKKFAIDLNGTRKEASTGG